MQQIGSFFEIFAIDLPEIRSPGTPKMEKNEKIKIDVLPH